jgi:hypothetical protein
MSSIALAGLVVLVLGDSHMAGRDYLLTSLHDQLVAEGASVHSYGMCGAAAGDWLYPTTVACGHGEHHDRQPPMFDTKKAATWQLGELIAKHHPNLIVIESADAMAGYGSPEMPKPWIYEQVRAFVGKVKAQNISCMWVGPVFGNDGPPYHKSVTRVRELSQFLSQSVAPCTYIDSTTFARPGEWPTPDGQHLTPAGYKLWGQDIAQAITRLRTQAGLTR